MNQQKNNKAFIRLSLQRQIFSVFLFSQIASLPATSAQCVIRVLANKFTLNVFKVVKSRRCVRWEPMSSTPAAYRPATLGPNGIRNNSEPCSIFPVLLFFWILWAHPVLSRLPCCCIISFHLHVKQVDTVFSRQNYAIDIGKVFL